MSLIERYIFKKATSATLTVLLALAGVVWIIQALKGVDVVNSSGQTIWAYLHLTSLAVPNLIVAIIPVALLISTIGTINTMNGNTELVVVTASGCSNWTIAKPLLILALLSSLFVGFVAHIVSPLSLIKLKDRVTEIRADLVSILIQEGTFNKIGDGLTFHISKREPGGVLSGILISDERDEKTSLIYTARQGVLFRIEQGSFLRLNDGEIHQTNRKDDAITIINYKSYIFDMSSFSGSKPTGQKELWPKERTTPYLLNPDPNDSFYQKFPGRYSSELHERFSEMLWPFAYVCMILAFAGQARSNRQSFAASITAATISVIIARGLGFAAINALKTDPLAVYMVYFLPLACIAFGSWFIITNQPASMPKRMADRIDKNSAWLAARFKGLVDAYRIYKRRKSEAKA